MAVFLFLRFGLVLLLIGLFSPSKHFINILTSVNAAAYKILEGGSPLKIIHSPPSKVTFKKPHAPLLLPCTPSILENILVTWFRNGEKLPNVHIYGNGSLKIPPNDKANGVYRCLINDTNLEYGALFSIQSIVEYPVIKRIHPLTNVTVTIGQSFLINCSIESVPMANITWFFENISIVKKFKENRYVQLQNGSIFIKNITQEFKGKYKCIATNDFSTKSTRQSIIHLIVVHPSSSSSSISQSHLKTDDKIFFGQLIPTMQNDIQYIPVGNNLKLYCNTYTDGIKIEWWFKSLNNPEFVKISNNSISIDIRNVAIDQHEGIYKCSTNYSSQSFHVIVTTPPVIESKLYSYESSMAATISFNCTVTSGNPIPNITWYRNGVELDTSYTIHIKKSSLRIQSLDLEDAGIYQCFAKNIAGESVTTGYIALRQMHNIDSLPEQPKNVKCYPVNSNTVNITFDYRQAGMFTLMNVYMASKNPPTWIANFPQTLRTQNHFIIDRMLPIFEPFKLFLRSIIVTATRKVNGGQPESSVETSKLSEKIDCATQGMEIHSFMYQKGIFIWWLKINMVNIKYYIIQFLQNELNTIKFRNEINGTTVPINGSWSHHEIELKFTKISLLNKVLQNNELNNNYDNAQIINIVVPNNVTGIFIPNIENISVRILTITEHNENLIQDYRYLQWKIFKDRTEVKVKSIESRKVNFIWDSLLKISCIYVCYINLNQFIPDYGSAECKNISMNSVLFSVNGLKPRTSYEMTFKVCNHSEFFSNIEIYTIDDPPGPISNYTILKSQGLKLIWKPPVNPNGKIKHYIIYWTFNNRTHETKIAPSESSFTFPNVTEDDKFNITVRVVGDSGIGLPIYIDLNKLSKPLIKENDNNTLIDHTLGIAIGIILSIMCIVIFMFLFVRQRRHFKLSSPYTATAAGSARSDSDCVNGGGVSGIDRDGKNLSEFQIQLTSSPTTTITTDQQNFHQNSTTTTIPLYRILADEHHPQLQQRLTNDIDNLNEFYEMQTLIPKLNNVQIKNNNDNAATSLPIKNILPNGNGNDDDENGKFIECPVALCTSTPLPTKSKKCYNDYQQQQIDLIPNQENLINTYENNKLLTKISSSPNFTTNNTKLNGNCNAAIKQTSENNKIPTTISPSVNPPNTSKIKNPLKKTDSVKIFLPLKKHSISSATSEPKLVNGYDSSQKHPIDSNSNTSPVDNNSQIKLIGNNSSSCDKFFCQNSTLNNCSDNNCTTETTLLNFDDSNSINNTNSICKQIKKTNWNHRRPIVDPNG